MPEYARFARFYDEVMDDPGPRGARVIDWIDRFRPEAQSVLELGCGTGSILAQLSFIPSVTGLDRSPEMLAVASLKVPTARLLEGDMATFSLGETFDVVVCVFDSLNHLLSFEQWKATFDAVHEHLVDDGLLLFDVNTVGELQRLADEPPWVFDFDENVFILDVSMGNRGLSWWDIRIFEHLGLERFQLHHERIGELGVDLVEIRAALAPNFEILEETNEEGGNASDDSVKAHFAVRRRRT